MQFVFLAVCSGLEFWRIREMVNNLEKSAIQANTTSERLALQLQSVELQISMVTLVSLGVYWLSCPLLYPVTTV
jgi:hypothetical protein